LFRGNCTSTIRKAKDRRGRIRLRGAKMRRFPPPEIFARRSGRAIYFTPPGFPEVWENLAA
jgi:hypothetical protein